ncbi:MAG: restriction endonuclease, partial [Planctomycetota bacterium]
MPFKKAVGRLPRLLFQAAVVKLGDEIDEGQIVKAVAIPWLELTHKMLKDPDFSYKIPWRKLEELIAGAYVREGWDEVILTPRSGDSGRDIIAVKHGICKIRIIDQVKAYGPGQRVTANDVRALLGVLSSDLNVSKGFVTTTADFAPRIYEDPSIKPFLPYRLDLRDGVQLREWLLGLAGIIEK